MSVMDSDIYQLQPLLYPALPRNHRLNPNSPAAISLAVRCAESNSRNLYVGSSDGVVHHYVLRDEGSSRNPNQFDLISSKVVSPSGKPVERLLILHRIGVAAVLAESILTFLHLPNLDALPPNTLPVVKAVSTVVLDDAEVEGDGTDGQGYVSLCVVKRRQVVLAKIGMGRWLTVKELPIPPGIMLVRRYGDTLCAASTTDYSLINLTTAAVTPLGLPISHSQESPSASTRPSIVTLPATSGNTATGEFLITSHSDEQTLGVFMTSSGEPAAKLIEFSSHPRALCVEWPNLVALLRDDTVAVYSLESMQRIQKIQLPDLIEPRLLSSGQTSLDISLASRRQDKFVKTLHHPFRPTEQSEDRASSYVDFTATVKNSAWRDYIMNGNDRQSKILMTCKDAVQALCEPIPLSEAVSLIANERWASLEALAEREWVKEGQADRRPPILPALQHIYGLLALRHLSMLNFYAASVAFQRSSLDYRLILRLFPKLWSSNNEEQVEVFSALQPLLEHWCPVEDMVAANLQQNYSDGWQDNAVLQQLQSQLLERAYDLAESVLEGARDRHSSEVDTALAVLYGTRHQRDKLSALLKSENACDVEVVGTYAKELGATAALAELYLRRGDIGRALELWTAMIDGDIADAEMTRGVEDVVKVLEESQQPDLQSKYALWVVNYDVQGGVNLLTRSSGKVDLLTSVDGADHQSILEKLRAAGATGAAEQFIERIVLSQPQASSLHQNLIDITLSRVEVALLDHTAKKISLELTKEYAQGGYAEGFVGHLAIQSSASPVILDRLKLIMLLQGSSHYDADALLMRIDSLSSGETGSLLAYERAILLGKLSRHEEALKLLALELRDANSSEAYCSQGGIVLSPFMAAQIASTAGEEALSQYAALVARGAKAKRVKGQIKDRLLMALLKVYMESGSDTTFRTATSHLLNTQALRLTTLDVLPVVSDDWPLSTLSTFLKRNLRRESHRRHEGSIKRAVALSQSLEGTEQAWRTMRAMGGVIQEADEGGGGAGSGVGDAAAATADAAELEAETSIVDYGSDGYEKKADGSHGPRQEKDQVVEVLADKELPLARGDVDVSGRPRGRY